MNIRILLLCLAGLLSSLTYAQDSIAYEMTFYFEDAVGNRDSVVVGGSPFADGGGEAFIPAFGEVNLIDQPFDSVFEVRVGALRPFVDGRAYKYFGKKRINIFTYGYNGTSASQGGRLDNFMFVVNSIHPPLTVSWSATAFRQQPALAPFMGCSIVNSFAPLLVNNWFLFPTVVSACLGDTGEITFPTHPSQMNDGGFDFGANGLFAVNGSDTLVELPIYLFDFARTGSSPCYNIVDVVGTPTPSTSLTLSPNPATDRLFLGGTDPTGGSLVLYDGAGRQAARYPDLRADHIDVQQLKAGVYFYRYRGRDGRLASGRLVKQ